MLPIFLLKSKGLLRSFVFLLFLSIISTAAFAEVKKFVYVYNRSGELLLPNNAAGKCPDPAGGYEAAAVCHGVLVDEDGNYSIRLDTDHLAHGNLVLVANEYEISHAPGSDHDVFAMVASKRRIDSIKKDATNDGVDINDISEATVEAVEHLKHVPQGKKGFVINELAQVIDTVDAAKINHTMCNSQTDNNPTDDNGKRVSDYLLVQQERLDQNQQDVLVSLAEKALENETNDRAQSLIRKNVFQGLLEPAKLSEVATRVYSHISDLQITDPAAPLMLLEADKYLLYFDEPAKLTTANSLNADSFFAYTWQGVQSDTATATFSKPDKGSYLVCATGEIDSSNDSSTDCIRIVVKDHVEAVARASRLRVGTGNNIKLSASLSLGAQTFSWSGSGVFSDSSAEITQWTAPQVPGTYDITLGINNNEDNDTLTVTVFDVLPVAVAEASPYVVYLQNQTASSVISSGSISTDGSAVDTLQWSILQAPPGAQASIADSTATTTQFTTNIPGDYTVQLLATRRSHTDTAQINIQVRDPDKPKANAGDDQTTYRNQAVMLDGSRSYAAQGRELTYSWNVSGATLDPLTQPTTHFITDSLGIYDVTLDVDDGLMSDSDSVTVTVVNRAPAASDDVYADLLNEILYGQLVAHDADKDTISYSLVKEPVSGGVTIDPASGAFKYVPGGVKGCQYQPHTRPEDNDKGGKDVPVIKLCADKYVIAPGDTVHLTTSNSINASKFSGYQWLGGAVGDPDDMRLATYVGSSEGLHHVCVQGNIGQSNNTSTACVDIIVNPDLGSVDDDVQTGYVDKFYYKVYDGDRDSNVGAIIITIGWKNTPAVVSDLAITTPEDTATSGQLQGSDADGHVLSFKIVNNGSIGTLTLDDSATGAFHYEPKANANGVDTISYVANDGFEDSAPGTITITVESTNDAPVAHFTGPLTTLEDNATGGMLGVTDPDVGQVMDFRLATLPSKGEVVITNAQTGAFTYTPRDNVNGSDSFFFVVFDGELESNAAKVDINITPVNDAPLTQDVGPLDVHSDETLHGSLTATDVDKDALLYKILTQPSKGSVTLDGGTGEFLYTPNGQDLGTDSFTYAATDSQVESNASTVSLNILRTNQAPECTEPAAIGVFEGVPYGGSVSCSDPDGGSLTYIIVDKGHSGSAAFANPSVGDYVYTPNRLASGADYFTFKVSDGDKESNTITVHIDLINACSGPGNDKRDTDGDGYADIVENEFGSLANDAGSTPLSQITNGATVSFLNDDDNDGYSDIAELWLNSDYKEPSSTPSQSTLKGVPNCLTPYYDTQPPALFAFNILTPDIDATTGNAKAHFALSAFDNAAGIASVNIQLKSPSGEKLSGQAIYSSKSVGTYVEFDSDTFSQYAETGTWNVDTLTITDASGNQLVLSGEDLNARQYPHTLNVTGTERPRPQLDSFQIITPSVNTCNNDIASLQIQAHGDVSIARVAVILRSPSGENFNWGELTASNPTTSWTATINSFAYRVFPETGSWQVSEVTITDSENLSLTLNTADLQTQGYPTDINVSGCTPAQIVLNKFTVLTPQIMDGGSQFEVDVSSSLGISKIKLQIQHGAEDPVDLPPFSAMDVPTSLVQVIQGDNFNACTDNGSWRVYSLSVLDALGNETTWTRQQLADLGFSTDFIVQLPIPAVVGYCGDIPSAYSSSFLVDEDSQYSGSLMAYDILNHPLTYTIVKQGNIGMVNVDPASGDFTYTPNADAYGEDSFTFKVNDGTEDSRIATVTITVNPIADPTLIKDLAGDIPDIDLAFSVEQDKTYNGQVEASDADRLPLSYNVVNNGQHGTATFLTNNTFQYVPEPGFVGTDQFTFRVNDANSSSRLGIVSVTVTSNKPTAGGFSFSPVRISSCIATARIEIQVQHNRANSEYSQATLTLEGPHGQVIGFSAVPQGSGNTFTLVNQFSTADIQNGFEAGVWTFKNLLMKRVGDIYSQMVMSDIAAAGFPATLEVVDNCPPVAQSDSITVPVNEIYHGTLAATDPEGDPLTYRINPNVTTGIVTLVDATTGAFTYAPTSLEDDRIQFVANDGLSDSNVAEITIKIVSTPAPSAFPITIDVADGTAFAGLLHGEDASGNPLTYSLVAAPSSGDVVISDASSGAFVYYPKPGFSGDSFTYKVNNGIYDSDAATVTIRKSSAPSCVSSSVNILKNVPYSGTLSCTDPDNDTLSYQLVSLPSRGTVSVNPSTGAYVYTPVTDAVGPDSFVFNASDGVHTSSEQTITVNIIGSCPTGGIYKGIDSDEDGYVDYLESALGTDPHSSNSTPADIDPQTLGVNFSNDYDGDSYNDYIELWMQSDPADMESVPEYVFDSCFDSTSDGIKPRLIGFNIETPVIDISSGQTSVKLSMSLLDNASGIKRARVSLLSPSGVFITTSASFSTYPLLTGVQLITDPLSQYAEQGNWQISGITIYDEAGNRLDFTAEDLDSAGFPATLEVVNLNSDVTAPTLEDFTILTSNIVYAGTENKRMSVSLTVSDDSSGIASARVDFISPSGTIVSASKTLAQNPPSTTLQLDTDILSSHLEDGIWTVHNVLLVDAAGNSAQVVDQLDANGFAKTLTVTNPNSDSVAPTLESFSVLTPQVYPLTGDARMSFAVTAYDSALNMNGNDPAGVAKIRIEITGPAGQKRFAWGYLTAPYPATATVQIDTAILSTLTQEGQWNVTAIEVFDEAGNSGLYSSADLSVYPTGILVSH